MHIHDGIHSNLSKYYFKHIFLSYYKELTSLRGIAVILVILSHWYPSNFILNRYTQNGILGVTLFFVLSGFLITGILYKQKLKIDFNESIIKSVKTFYIRRSLRIFPIYYFVLTLVLIFNKNLISESFGWHFFYLSNVYFYLTHSWQGELSHLWSLSVEEQFYLVFPFLIYFIKNTFHLKIIFFGILISFLFKILIISETSFFGRFLILGSIDSFFIGSFFAISKMSPNNIYDYFKKNKTYLVLIFISFFIIVHLPFFNYFDSNYYTSIYLIVISIGFGILIDDLAVDNTKKVYRYILNNKILFKTGELSYGIYLFHNFVPKLHLSQFSTSSYTVDILIENISRFIVLYFISFLAYKFIEKPFLNLKEKFHY